MPDEIQQSGLVGWLKANAIASVLLMITIIGAIYATGRWVSTNEASIASNATDISQEKPKTSRLQNDMVNVDKRLVDEKTDREKGDASIGARIDIMDTLSKAVAGMAVQPPLPTPYQPPAKKAPHP